MMNKCSICNKYGHNKRYHFKENIVSKRCNLCNLEKPINEFYKKRKILSGGREVFYLSYDCKKCDNKNSRDFYTKTVKGKMIKIFNAAKSSSKKNNIPFDITIDFILDLFNRQNGRCYYSNIAMTSNIGRMGISIDKKIPELGYVKSNVVLTIWLVNNMKRDLTDDEFFKMCKLISNKN